TVKALADAGARIMAVSDVSGALYQPEGLDILRVLEHTRRHPRGLLEGYAGEEAEVIDNATLLTLDCDVLIPAALEGQIHGGNAAAIQAPIIVEGANGPTTDEAGQILHDRGIQVVPDILANA